MVVIVTENINNNASSTSRGTSASSTSRGTSASSTSRGTSASSTSRSHISKASTIWKAILKKIRVLFIPPPNFIQILHPTETTKGKVIVHLSHIHSQNLRNTFASREVQESLYERLPRKQDGAIDETYFITIEAKQRYYDQEKMPFIYIKGLTVAIFAMMMYEKTGVTSNPSFILEILSKIKDGKLSINAIKNFRALNKENIQGHDIRRLDNLIHPKINKKGRLINESELTKVDVGWWCMFFLASCLLSIYGWYIIVHNAIFGYTIEMIKHSLPGAYNIGIKVKGTGKSPALGGGRRLGKHTESRRTVSIREWRKQFSQYVHPSVHTVLNEWIYPFFGHGPVVALHPQDATDIVQKYPLQTIDLGIFTASYGSFMYEYIDEIWMTAIYIYKAFIHIQEARLKTNHDRRIHQLKLSKFNEFFTQYINISDKLKVKQSDLHKEGINKTFIEYFENQQRSIEFMNDVFFIFMDIGLTYLTSSTSGLEKNLVNKLKAKGVHPYTQLMLQQKTGVAGQMLQSPLQGIDMFSRVLGLFSRLFDKHKAHPQLSQSLNNMVKRRENTQEQKSTMKSIASRENQLKKNIEEIEKQITELQGGRNGSIKSLTNNALDTSFSEAQNKIKNQQKKITETSNRSKKVTEQRVMLRLQERIAKLQKNKEAREQIKKLENKIKAVKAAYANENKSRETPPVASASGTTRTGKRPKN